MRSMEYIIPPQPTKALSILSLVLFFHTGCVPMSNLNRKSNSPLDGKNLGPATFSPDGNEIVFSAEDKGGKTSHIYKAKVDGTGVVQLTRGDTYDKAPAFSPDGKRVVYSKIFEHKQADLYLVNSDGTQETRLTSGPADDSGPIFSPDGRKIYFIRAEWFGHYSPIARSGWHDSDICSISMEGGDLKKITSSKYFRIMDLSISPDGRTLMAAIKDGESPYTIWMLPIDNPVNMRPFKPNFDMYKIRYDELLDPELSPNGRQILFSVYRRYGDIFVIDLESNATHVLHYKEHYVYYPHFSKDGTKIIFRKDSRSGLFRTHEESKYYLVNTDGTGLRAIDFKQGLASP